MLLLCFGLKSIFSITFIICNTPIVNIFFFYKITTVKFTQQTYTAPIKYQDSIYLKTIIKSYNYRVYMCRGMSIQLFGI